ncbi:MAG: hypothetical protein IGR92_11700 [Leptolyngbyaceae cyanobacterium T60_A2020_046]|nr:hypothetical protein [Leptolyngbyaceae cyanobacterium T60_A2020_046]
MNERRDREALNAQWRLTGTPPQHPLVSVCYRQYCSTLRTGLAIALP